MSVLVYTESWGGNFRKSTFEAVSYASETAKILGTNVVALSLENVSDDELVKLGSYGASKVVSIREVKKTMCFRVLEADLQVCCEFVLIEHLDCLNDDRYVQIHLESSLHTFLSLMLHLS